MTNKQDFSKEVLAGYLDHAVLDPVLHAHN